jgi:hypothetical protein
MVASLGKHLGRGARCQRGDGSALDKVRDAILDGRRLVADVSLAETLDSDA